MAGLFAPSEARTEVEASPEAVYRVISDPTTYPDWLVGAQRIRGVDPEFPKPGSSFDHSVGPADGVTVDDSTEAIDADPPHRLGLHVRAGIFHANVEILVLPSPKGSEIRFSEKPTGPAAALTPVLRPVLHARNAGSLRRLSAYLEERDGNGTTGTGGS
ncbi:MAG: SRPBCC family protein [Acidimicrobiales bacterium]|nr:SRPBCC family protein [Acidimicrobiales bacterium]